MSYPGLNQDILFENKAENYLNIRQSNNGSYQKKLYKNNTHILVIILFRKKEIDHIQGVMFSHLFNHGQLCLC